MKQNKTKRIKAVIFDMDGVISDTLGFHGIAESQTLLKYGVNMSIEQLVQEYNGVPDIEMFSEIFAKRNKKVDIKKVFKEKWKLMNKIIINSIKPIPGVIRFINLLKNNGFLLGVASSTPIEFINHVVKTLNIEEKFNALTSTNEVKQGKPKPDIFLLTAKKLGISPKNCVVIEDAPSGIKAAKAGQMKCIAITTNHPKRDLKNADKIINKFSEVTLETLQNL